MREQLSALCRQKTGLCGHVPGKEKNKGSKIFYSSFRGSSALSLGEKSAFLNAFIKS